MILHGDMVDSPLRKNPGAKTTPECMEAPNMWDILYTGRVVPSTISILVSILFFASLFFSPQGGGLVGGVCSDMSIGELGKQVEFGEGSSGFD